MVQVVAVLAALVAVVLLFASSNAGDGEGEGEGEGAAAGSEATSNELGRQVYAEECAICHGDTGQGGTGPAFTTELDEKYPDPAVLQAVVANGVNAMPGFSTRLEPEEISAVTDLLVAGL